jgi:digeranylgeranylglycerophospholipid reductase
MPLFDVAVVGAGPSGCMAAKYAARAGASVVLFEEHSCIGWPVACAGLLGTRALVEAELPVGRYILQDFKGASVYSPGGFRMDFKAASSRAWAVDRRLFDRAIALDALKEGAELKLCSPVRRMTRAGQSWELDLREGGTISSKVVISAEGVRARLARLAGIPPPRKILSGAQVEAVFQVEDQELVEVHLGASPGFFAWVIPLGEDQARIGLCSRENACRYLRAFLRKEGIRDRLQDSAAAMVAGGLPLGPPRRTVSDGLIAVGDCAGQVKPTSGGGIYPGLVCAKIAGAVAADAAKNGDCSAKRLSDYDRRWRAALGMELALGMQLYKLIHRARVEELDELVSLFAKKKSLQREIEVHGDIDRPSLLLTKMVPHLGLDGLRLMIRLLS